MIIDDILKYNILNVSVRRRFSVNVSFLKDLIPSVSQSHRARAIDLLKLTDWLLMTILYKYDISKIVDKINQFIAR